VESVRFIDLGLRDYKETWSLQEEIFDSIVADKIAYRDKEQPAPSNHHLLFCQHNAVITMGKSGDIENLLYSKSELERRGIQYYKINRGGDITFHGPGQLVAYPIFDLDYFFTDIHRYMRSLEEVVIRTLNDYGIDGQRLDGSTGVWLGVNTDRVRKICALGVRASRWVVMHGLAFNVNTDLDYFSSIVPCGINDKAITSMAEELGGEINFAEVSERIKHHFKETFQLDYI